MNRHQQRISWYKGGVVLPARFIPYLFELPPFNWRLTGGERENWKARAKRFIEIDMRGKDDLIAHKVWSAAFNG